MWNYDEILSVLPADVYVMFHLLQFHMQEMAVPNIRETIYAYILLSYYTSFMLTFLVLFIIGWKISARGVASSALVDLVAYSFLHESPVWYVRNNRISDARKVFSWLWGYGHHVEVRLTHPLYIYRTADTVQQVTLLCMI